VDASKLLQQAIDSANQIQDARYQAYALSAIAEAIGKLGKEVDASKLLQQALDSANQIQAAYYQADALSAIALAHVEISKATSDPQLLSKALDIAKKISGDDRDRVLSAIAEVNATQKNWGKARQAVNLCLSDPCRVDLLSTILTIKAEQDRPVLVENKENEDNDDAR